MQLELRHADVRTQTSLWSGAHWGGTVVVANLLRPVLLELARAIHTAPAHLLAGGLLAAQSQEVANTFARHLGMCERERREEQGWAALWLSHTGQGRLSRRFE